MEPMTLVMTDEEYIRRAADFEKEEWWESANVWLMYKPGYQVVLRLISLDQLTQDELDKVADVWVLKHKSQPMKYVN